MTKKCSLWLAVVFAAGLLAQAPASADEKMDQVLKNQDEILKKLDEIKSELEIVKIRASQR